MTSYTSPTTGNTSWTSDCGLFSSLNKNAVVEFETLNIKTKYDFTWGSSLTWSFAGNCPIADEYRHDISKANVLEKEAMKDFQRSSKYGKNCNLFRERDAGKKAKNDFLKSKGYNIGGIL